MISDCTFLIKTFLRRDCLARLLLSIHRHYPRVPTVVVDDSGNGDARECCQAYPNVRFIQTAEKDVGISAGRNIGLQHVTTKYFVLLDDDCIFYRLSAIEAMIRRLEQEGADIVCGPMCDLDTGVIRQAAMGFLELAEGRSILVQSRLAKGKEGWVGTSNNFFLGKTSLRDVVQWPPELKTNEHAPYFWLLARAGGRVWIQHESSVAHLPVNSDEYERYRYRKRTKIDKAFEHACNSFENEHGFSWLTAKLIREFGEEYLGYSLRWRRQLEPWCETQSLFLAQAAKIYARVSKRSTHIRFG